MSSRRDTVLIWLLALLALPFAGCSALDRHRERKIPQYGEVDCDLPRELQKVSMPPHVVEPPDSLQITVKPIDLEFDTPNVKVQPDGVIDLGFYGDVYVAGLTLREVEEKLTLRLLPQAEKQKLKDRVKVAVKLIDGGGSKRYYVLGVVDQQRSFALNGNETVLDGILQAGLKSNSLPNKAYLVRPHPTGGADQVFRIDWFGITERGDTLTNYQLMPGDRIYVPGTKPPSLLQTLFRGG